MADVERNRPNYRAHSVIREDRPDGAILLRSGYEMSEVADTSGDWLNRWSGERPETVFLAERSGAGWREVTYSAALQQVRAIASALLDRGLTRDTPILIISGNGVDHGLLSLAAHYVGIPTVPVAEQYSLIPGAESHLKYVIGLTRPGMVYAVDGEKFGRALALEELAGLDKVVSTNVQPGETPFADLLRGGSADVDAAAAQVGPDSMVKILMTSGSTSNPKGVITTHRMMCANQAQLLDALPFLQDRAPRIVDWLPWNHVFGGSHNFNMMLASGGSLYIDGGKPAKGLIQQSIENLSMVSGTLAFNVPVGFAMLRDAMKKDAGLRRSYFEDLDMLFYAGASLPQDVWRDLEEMATEVRGHVPLMNSSWGLTETAPATLIQHEPTDRSGIVGVPMTGVTVKLVPTDDERFEVRVKGPNIMSAYFEAPDKTADAFDEDGYFCTGDAMAFVDPADMDKGLRFDGRIAEDFKLLTGIWVRAAGLRLEALGRLTPWAADVVVVGEGHNEVGLLIVPSADALAAGGYTEGNGRYTGGEMAKEIGERLRDMAKTAAGSSNRITRALIMSEPPSMAEGEITAKGNLNFRKIQQRRKDLVEALYDDKDEAVIRI
ncbi:feruloyl-CoA synthase [Albibacillus kandeliae]|uniref:feruloyl-CoA synthase n=1 Tax=Albibacillus kandeliae TaxID=2174228 RepID=UPI001E4225B3|nr:feruloyl-CoA synthase [Albibacillus kandeliae]